MKFHSHRLISASFLLATLSLGCGQAPYDRLVETRLADLRAGRGAVARWEFFQSGQLGYSVEFPGRPNQSTSGHSGIISEKIDANVGSVAYQVYAAGGEEDPLENVVPRVRDQYQSAGFQFESRSDGNVNALDYVRLQFNKPDSAETARVQVLKFSGDHSCAMSVVGESLNDEDVARFFDSFIEQQ